MREIQEVAIGDEEEQEERRKAWDDVKGAELLFVKATRKEEVGYMRGRNLWGLRSIKECLGEDWQGSSVSEVG